LSCLLRTHLLTVTFISTTYLLWYVILRFPSDQATYSTPYCI